MKLLRVYRRGPSHRLVLTVTLRGSHLRLEGNSQLISSLEKEGVVDFQSGRSLPVERHLESEEAQLTFNALYWHFERASAYQVEIKT